MKPIPRLSSSMNSLSMFAFALVAHLLVRGTCGLTQQGLRKSSPETKVLALAQREDPPEKKDDGIEHDHKEYNNGKYPGWHKEYPYNKTKEKHPEYPEESEGKQHHPDYSEKEWDTKEKKEPEPKP